MTSELVGPNGNILRSPPRERTFYKYFPDGEPPPPPPPPPIVATRPWIGSSQAEGLTGFNRLQTQIVQRSLELRTVFSSSFVADPTSVLMPDIAAGRVPSYSLKPPSSPSQWDTFAANIAALPGFVIATVNHEPENDGGYSAAQYEDDFSEMYTRCSAVPNLWMGPVYMRVTYVSQDPARIAYMALLDTMAFDLIQVDGYNQLYKMSFAQLFNPVAAKARSRTDLNTDPTITGVPWAVRETAVHGTDIQRANWVNSARLFWEKPENRDLVAVNWFDSDLGDNAAIVGWRMERALPVGWYPQTIPPSTKTVARAAPPFDPEWVEDLLTPAAIRNAMGTPRRALGPVIPPPVPPPTPPQYGALALGETNYLIPLTDVKFCSPAGVDTAAGTELNPYRTLQKAVDNCPVDGTVVMRGGEYPESVNGKQSTPMTIQAYPGEAPILIGSNVVTGWLQDNTGPGGTPRWRRNNWTTEFDETPLTSTIVDPAHPEAPRPYQVWIDDVPLQQVLSLAEVVATAPDEAGAPGTFWQDTASNVLWIGSTPFNKTVRVAVRQTAFNNAQNPNGDPRVDLKGIGVMHYATSSNQYAAVKVYAPDTLIEHCHIIGNSAAGIFINTAAGVRLIHNTIERNGQFGVRSYQSPFLEIAYNRVYKNNRKYFATGAAAGGMKIDTHSYGLNCHHNQVIANHGHGVWSDGEGHYSAFWRNDVRDHVVSSGIFFELGIGAAIYGNYFRGNSIALLNSECSGTEVWNNTFVDNTYHWRVRMGDRPESLTYVSATFTQVSYHGGNNVFAQYIADNAVRLVALDDPHGGTIDIDEADHTIDYSAAYRLTAGTSKYADVLLASGVQTTYATQDNYQTGTGREVHGIWQDGGSDPYLQADKSTPIVLGPLIESGTPAPDYVGTNLEWTVEQIATPNRGWQ